MNCTVTDQSVVIRASLNVMIMLHVRMTTHREPAVLYAKGQDRGNTFYTRHALAPRFTSETLALFKSLTCLLVPE